VGSFHRSHQAVYFDELARQGVTDWGVTGVGLRRHEMHEALAPQDWLYTVVERGDGPDRARVVGVMGDYLFGPEDPAAVVDALADARTRLVTLTVTGDGYETSGAPHSAVALLVAGLEARHRAGRPPFTVLSCDNLPANGDVARDAVLTVAERRDPRLARWIERHGAFPSSMVDRITPMTTDEDRRRLAETFGVEDRWPVVTEPYSEWIVEDQFCDGRPPLDEVGVRFVADVRPYTLIKTRLLNATHCALGHLGSLAGHTTTDGAMADPLLAAYIERLTRDEILPLLPRVPGLDLEPYRQSVLARLRNPKIGDQLARLCRNHASKVARHLVPSIEETRRLGRPHPLLSLAAATDVDPDAVRARIAEALGAGARLAA
jgi:mannitol-1-phosphate/altronate dehydrogenase